jgi:hypothetical protein
MEKSEDPQIRFDLLPDSVVEFLASIAAAITQTTSSTNQLRVVMRSLQLEKQSRIQERTQQ